LCAGDDVAGASGLPEGDDVILEQVERGQQPRLLVGGHGPISASLRQRLVTRTQGGVHAAVGVDLEVEQHEVVGGAARERRANGGDRVRGVGRRLVEPAIEAVVGGGAGLLALEEERERALHLVEDALGDRLVADAPLELGTLQGALHQQARRNREGQEEQQQCDADASHPEYR
jgi:hypothetical protein